MRAKLLMVSAGTALVMGLSACGSSESDAPEKPPGIVNEDPVEEATDEPLYDTPAEETTDQPLNGDLDEYYDHKQLERQNGLSNEDLLDDGYENFQRNMGSSSGW
ncbi:hypothetical protein [Streptomyces ochraceiscleroticus]|uniref:Lipoprotein n=1 Tax=Streptomyces ochraceiscleroticus TaxID=47761 RepID=A0ABW1MID8_9ACTN|nr:hypothetical protein [Streptomyces ochraceiscleroticus]